MKSAKTSKISNTMLIMSLNVTIVHNDISICRRVSTLIFRMSVINPQGPHKGPGRLLNFVAVVSEGKVGTL